MNHFQNLLNTYNLTGVFGKAHQHPHGSRLKFGDLAVPRDLVYGGVDAPVAEQKTSVVGLGHGSLTWQASFRGKSRSILRADLPDQYTGVAARTFV